MLMKLLDRIEEIIIGALMASATVLIFVAVCHRYGSGIPVLYPYLRHIDLSWAQELCIYMFVWMAKFGAAYGVRTGIHVGVDVLVNMVEPDKRKPLVAFALLSGALFTFIIGSLGANFVWHMSQTEQTSVDLEMPMWLVYLAIPLGSYLMSFRFLQTLANFFKTGELPQHDHGHVDGMDIDAAPVSGAKA
jgi:C4-dicarboxylate transporter DctQ subunit